MPYPRLQLLPAWTSENQALATNAAAATAVATRNSSGTPHRRDAVRANTIGRLTRADRYELVLAVVLNLPP